MHSPPQVLGRVADQGLCCPVFTEKKTERYTAVVSVAVKAITVARGYVANEGTGHELGFLPYLRGGEGGGFHGHGYSQGGGPGEDERSDEMQQYLIEQGGPQHRYKGSGGGAREGQHNRMMGMQHGMREDEEEGGHSGYSERAEMAFDVYKLPQVCFWVCVSGWLENVTALVLRTACLCPACALPLSVCLRQQRGRQLNA